MTYFSPHLYSPDHNLGYSELWEPFEKNPGEVRKYKTFWIKWRLEKNPSNSLYARHSQVCFYSKNNGQTWVKFDVFNDRNQEFYKALVDEAVEHKKNFFKERSRKQAKIRRKKLLDEAQKKGIDFAELQKLKSEERQKNLKKKQETKKAVSLASKTNKKMQIGSALKELLEVANDLQAKLLDGSELNLNYVDNRIHKIIEARRILEEWSQIKRNQ